MRKVITYDNNLGENSMNLLQVRENLLNNNLTEETTEILLECVERQSKLSEILNDNLVAYSSEMAYSPTEVSEMLSSVSVYEEEYRKEFGLGKE